MNVFGPTGSIGKSGQFEAVSYGLRAARNLCDRGAAAQGSKFKTALPKVDSLFSGSGLATISPRDSRPFFDVKITPICLAINLL